MAKPDEVAVLALYLCKRSILYYRKWLSDWWWIFKIKYL